MPIDSKALFELMGKLNDAKSLEDFNEGDFLLFLRLNPQQAIKLASGEPEQLKRLIQSKESFYQAVGYISEYVKSLNQTLGPYIDEKRENGKSIYFTNDIQSQPSYSYGDGSIDDVLQYLEIDILEEYITMNLFAEMLPEVVGFFKSTDDFMEFFISSADRGCYDVANKIALSFVDTYSPFLCNAEIILQFSELNRFEVVDALISRTKPGEAAKLFNAEQYARLKKMQNGTFARMLRESAPKIIKRLEDEATSSHELSELFPRAPEAMAAEAKAGAKAEEAPAEAAETPTDPAVKKGLGC
ncbi:MAG: hypothetical protein K0U23_03840 [Gammaproteobacteria bacterium]|nr:hypothetical protein [Gammaproteobacteria bacterium]